MVFILYKLYFYPLTVNLPNTENLLYFLIFFFILYDL